MTMLPRGSGGDGGQGFGKEEILLCAFHPIGGRAQGGQRENKEGRAHYPDRRMGDPNLVNG
jgi:hypothetical protein